MYDTLYHKIQFYILQMIIVSYFTILSKIKCIIWYNIMVQVCILQYTDMIYIIYYNIMYFMISWYKIALFHIIWYWIVLWNKYCIMNNMKLYMQHNRKLHHMIWSVIAFSSFVFLILFWYKLSFEIVIFITFIRNQVLLYFITASYEKFLASSL